MSQIRFLTKGFVSTGHKGPLSITALTGSELLIVEIPFKTHEVCGRLTRGDALEDILADLGSLQKTQTRIPVSGIASIRWIDGENDFRIEYLDENGRSRKKTTYISRRSDRPELIRQLEEVAGHRFREQQVPAGTWRLAWSQFLGAAMSVLGTLFLIVWWDPKAIAGARGGRLALLLGPTGCALVGVAFFVGCLVSAWRRLNPRPVEHRWAA